MTIYLEMLQKRRTEMKKTQPKITSFFGGKLSKFADVKSVRVSRAVNKLKRRKI